jgi:predicted nucleotidyltransferase
LLNPDYKDILSALNDEKAEYLVVGAYAMAVHGVPRATGDLDVWVNATESNAERVWKALERFGAPLAQLKKKDLSAPGLVYQIGVAPVRIDVLTSVSGVGFADAWRNRTTVEIGGIKVTVMGLAELIMNKKAVGRRQDLADVERLEKQRDQT